METTDLSASELTPANAWAELQKHEGKEFIKLFQHGSLEIEFYKPEKVDRQRPHERDEVYVIVSGSGYFVKGETRHRFEPGQILFVPAGVVHRFEDFSHDFATWVFFYGPRGGEKVQGKGDDRE